MEWQVPGEREGKDALLFQKLAKDMGQGGGQAAALGVRKAGGEAAVLLSLLQKCYLLL